MADSVDVLGMLKLVYTLYTLAVISLMAWFAMGVVNESGKPRTVKSSTFYMYVAGLVTVGIAIHIVTFNKIPWVETDFKRAHIQSAQVVNITIEKHEFKLPSPKIELKCNEYILFDVESKDLTYGFGIFRQNNSMVTQMQVVPGSKNDLMWKFGKNGTYHLRSTEYSGPKGAHMYIKDVFEVKGCSEDDKYSQKGASL